MNWLVAVETPQGKIAFQPADGVELDSIAVDGSTVVTKLGFAAQQSAHYTRLTTDSIFRVSVNGTAYVQVTVTADSTADNLTLADLVADFNTAFADASVDHLIRAMASGDAIWFITVEGGSRASIALDVEESDPLVQRIGFAVDGSALSALLLNQNLTLENLTIDNADDVDWYSFILSEDPGPNAEIKLSSASDLDGLGLALFPADGGGQLIEEDKIDIGGGNETAETAYLIENIADVAAVTGLSIYTAEDIGLVQIHHEGQRNGFRYL